MKVLTLAAAFLAATIGACSVHALTPAEEALFEAANTGSFADVERIVAQGTTVDVADEEHRTAMMYAAFNGHRQVVSFLLVNGARVDHKDGNGRTALSFARQNGHSEVVKLLEDPDSNQGAS